MTNIVGISALQELRKIEGLEKAVIAGGFCRDSVLNNQFKDLDIFVPCNGMKEFQQKIVKHFIKKPITINRRPRLRTYEITREDGSMVSIPDDEFFTTFSYHEVFNSKTNKPDYFEVIKNVGNFRNLSFSSEKYGNTEGYMGHFNCSYMGFLDVDIIGYSHKSVKNFEGKEDSFGEEVIKKFQFGLDMIYFDENTVRSKEFDHDAKYNTLTLHSLKSMADLPRAMEKYVRLKEKYPGYTFKSDCLELKKKDTQNQEKRFAKTIASNTFQWFDNNPLQAAINGVQREQANVAGDVQLRAAQAAQLNAERQLGRWNQHPEDIDFGPPPENI